MEDIEILEKQDCSKFIYPEQIQIKVIYKQVATAIVNGQVMQTTTVPSYVLVCPTCGTIIAELGENVKHIDIIKELSNITEDIEKKFAQYCSHCGQRLKYKKDII